MAVTYEPIATITLSAASGGQIFFSSIPQTYTDLRIIFTTTSTCSVYGYFNNDTSASYTGVSLYKSASAVGSSTFGTSFSYLPIAGGGNISYPSMYIIDIFNYTNTSYYKSVLGISAANQSGAGNNTRRVALWKNASAITSIGFVPYISGQFEIGTTATLYGIKAA